MCTEEQNIEFAEQSNIHIYIYISFLEGCALVAGHTHVHILYH